MLAINTNFERIPLLFHASYNFVINVRRDLVPGWDDSDIVETTRIAQWATTHVASREAAV